MAENKLCVMHESVEAKLEDHEGRIRVLEKVTVETGMMLKVTNKLLGVIATMIGGAIVTYLFKVFTT